MKFNITVDLDWLNEDESLDEAFQSRIIDAVIAKVSKETIANVTQQAERVISQQITELVAATYTQFLGKGVTITNRWGEVEKENVSVEGLIKERFDKFLTETVDEDGRTYSGYGNSNRTRLQWMLNDRIQKQTKQISEQIVREVDKKVKDYLNQNVKEAIGGKLVKELGIEELINKAKG